MYTPHSLDTAIIFYTQPVLLHFDLLTLLLLLLVLRFPECRVQVQDAQLGVQPA